jgi:type VI secretion system protein ImpC
MSEATEKAASQGQTATAESDDFTSLLRKEFKPQTERAREEVESAVMTLAREALSSTATTTSDAVASI